MKYAVLLLVCLFCFPVFAQDFSAELQIRPRFEYRNGYKTLLNEGLDATEFISQRSRLGLSYVNEDFHLRLSLQNAGVWGNEALNTSAGNKTLGIFEAYAEYFLNEKISFRMGRQIISYDNQRVLGAVDWAQNGLSHDALSMFWLPSKNQRLEIAVALNNSAENVVEEPYLVNTYKNLQLAWYHVDFKNSGLSFLLLNTGYEVENSFSERETQYQQTFGSFFNFKKSSWSGEFFAYGQLGERNNNKLEAWDAGAKIDYLFSKTWSTGVGAEYISGTDMGGFTGTNQSFSPLFGTNHAFNGLMDYFFVGNHNNSVGLVDIYGKLSYVRGKFDIAVFPHVFHSAANVMDFQNQKMENYLGTEIDITGNYRLQKDVLLSFGYSQMFAGETTEILKGGDHNRTQNWAWLSLNFNPMLFQFQKKKEKTTADGI